tara:strand:- start:387 stop:527 length:141 start_codon:yes stop_codon:yes gene_type:complete
MIGDQKRDLLPAIKLGLSTIQVAGQDDQVADYLASDLLEASKLILD